MKKIIGLLSLLISFAACSGAKGNTGSSEADTEATAPSFTANADSLYTYVEAQVVLGPRTPGSQAHDWCADLIETTLRQAGVDSIAVQLAPVTTFNGEHFTTRNIMGCINPTATRRVLLLAHYDTRPWADNDNDPTAHSTPVDGANDGASGVAVLLETARVTARTLPDSIGLDLLFVDMEDSGESGPGDTENSWCLGTQEWVKQMPYTTQNRPMFGILLDMVGGHEAVFHREYISNAMAPAVVNRVWAVARDSGYSDRFVNKPGGAVVDDHLFINRAGIPCIDIIESLNPATGTFNPTWHTTDDNLGGIDRNTMKIVAQTVLNTIAGL